uniref:Uncharacterized protein n=1 Tax=Anguilla anguilla TaxID=7936 RepID=A0A0E9UZA8_ANGAN
MLESKLECYFLKDVSAIKINK